MGQLWIRRSAKRRFSGLIAGSSSVKRFEYQYRLKGAMSETIYPSKS